MRRLRIGTDRVIVWSIYNDGKEYDISEKDLTLKVSAPGMSFFVDKDLVIEGNVLQWTFRGRDQKALGAYSLTLIENDGKEGMISFDKCNAFALVDCSCKEGGTDDANLSVSGVNLSSDLAAIGISVLTPYVGQNGNLWINGIDTGLPADVTSQFNLKVDKVEGKGLSTNDYTDEDKEKTLILGPHIGNDTEEHQANLLKAISDNACYGRFTIDGDTGTYISVGELSGIYYVDVIRHFNGNHIFTPDLARYKVVNGWWTRDYIISISEILTSSNLATQSEIDAIFDGNSEGSSSSY